VRGWLLDTNVVSELANPRGAPTVLRWGGGVPEDCLFISVLTLGEYDRGPANLPPESGSSQRLTDTICIIEKHYAGRVLSVADAAVRRWGSSSGGLMRSARSDPPVIDTLLAATALEHELYLVTRNVREVAGTGAAVFNPWYDDPALFPLRSRRISDPA